MATERDLIEAIYAAGRIVKKGRLLVIGSHAILGTYRADELPASATMSADFDVALIEDDADGTAATLIDVNLGEWSDFHSDKGWYVQGVSVDTAVLPVGWEKRVVAVPVRGSIEASCLDPHDLCAAKLARNEEKDRAYIADLIRVGIIDPRLLRNRIDAMPDERLSPVRKRVARNFVRSFETS